MAMSEAGRGGAPSVTPREAAERWLSKKAVECSEKTISSYWYRLKKVVDYCEANGIDDFADLSPWKLDEFDAAFRGRSPKRVTLSKEYRTINNWLARAESVGIAQKGLSEILDPPETTKDEEVNRDRLAPNVAAANLRAFRSQPVGGHRATLQHVTLELLWWTGARVGAVHGLDRGDVDFGAGTITFRHRPETGTPIKQAYNPERKVGLREAVVDVLREYIDHHRIADTFDDNHREPLLTTTQGRAATQTLQRYAYYASLPCQGGPCPHDQEPATCEWNALREAYGCPSAQGPHAIRTGAISNLLNSGWPIEAVAERVNTSPATLQRHYDFPTLDEQYRERRADLVAQLGLDDHTEDDQ